MVFSLIFMRRESEATIGMIYDKLIKRKTRGHLAAWQQWLCENVWDEFSRRFCGDHVWSHIKTPNQTIDSKHKWIYTFQAVLKETF